MKGVFHNRPALPKYNVTWDVDDVVKFLASWPDIQLLTLRQLTLRLAMLLCLVSGQRGEAIHKMKVSDIKFVENMCTITFSSILKTSTPKRHTQPLQIHCFENERLCVVSHLRRYLLITQEFRSGEQLFLTYLKPHKPIARNILSRWIKQVLKLAGIDTEIYTAHSTRAASTSAANARNVPIDQILKAAGWSNKTSFVRFYHKPVQQLSSPESEPSFANAVLVPQKYCKKNW